MTRLVCWRIEVLPCTGYVRPEPSNAPFWSIDVRIPRLIFNLSNYSRTLQYYQRYFDVDTKTVRRRGFPISKDIHIYTSQVISRCYHSMIPKEDYVSVVLESRPDLYGPFWTLTTVIFALFVFSSLASSITSYLSAKVRHIQYIGCDIKTHEVLSAMGLRLQATQRGRRYCVCIWTRRSNSSMDSIKILGCTRLGHIRCRSRLGLWNDNMDVSRFVSSCLVIRLTLFSFLLFRP